MMLRATVPYPPCRGCEVWKRFSAPRYYAGRPVADAVWFVEVLGTCDCRLDPKTRTAEFVYDIAFRLWRGKGSPTGYRWAVAGRASMSRWSAKRGDDSITMADVYALAITLARTRGGVEVDIPTESPEDAADLERARELLSVREDMIRCRELANAMYGSEKASNVFKTSN